MPTDPVTVVIPTRNRLAFLRDSVASIQRQTKSDWRLVVVDDASEDGTRRWVDSVTDERVRLVSLPSRSERSAARNRGLAECGTPFVLFLDDDDLLRPAALETLTSALAGSGRAVAAIGACVYFDDEGHRSEAPHPTRRLERRVWIESVFGWVVNTSRTLFRAAAVRQAGGFREELAMGEDRDLWLRLSRLGPAVFVPDVVADYRVHPGQWRPPQAEALEAEITERAFAAMAPADRAEAERAVRFAADYHAAYAALNDSRHRDALRLFASARRAPRSLVLSPLLRRRILTGLGRAAAGSILGPQGVRAVRALRGRRATGERWDVPAPRRGDSDHG